MDGLDRTTLQQIVETASAAIYGDAPNRRVFMKRTGQIAAGALLVTRWPELHRSEQVTGRETTDILPTTLTPDELNPLFFPGGTVTTTTPPISATADILGRAETGTDFYQLLKGDI